MHRYGASWFVLGLLVLGGIVFAGLVSRTADLQTREAEREAEDRARGDLDRFVARLPGRAQDPTGAALATWRIIPAPNVDPRATASASDLLAFAEAEYAERRADDPAGALAIYARIAGRESSPMARLAALRAGTIARRRGDVRAPALFDLAGTAAPDLADPSGAGVRVSALYHLALMGFARDDGSGARTFVEAIGQGFDIVEDTPVTVRDLMAAVYSAAPEALRADLAAAERATRIVAVLPALPTNGFTVSALRPDGRDAHGLYVRRGATIDLFELDVLARPAEDGSAVLQSTDYPVGESDRVRALDARFGRAGLVAVAHVDSATAGAWSSGLPLWAGFAIYVFGAGLAFTALRRSAKAAAMQGDFVAAVSHELKTPIASVRAMAEMLAQGEPKPERTRKYAERMAVEMERLGNTVRNVLDAAQIERQGMLAVRREPADPEALLRRVGETARPAFEHAGFTFDVQADPASDALRLDPDAITAALVNLLDNAAKFDRERKDVTLSGDPTDGGYRFMVEDRGPGVPAGERRALFTQFQRGAGAKMNAVPGIGLGLYVVRQVAEAHGGTVRVEDRPGGGARFVLEIPGEAS